MPLGPEHDGDITKIQGSILTVMKDRETGDFVGLYALTPEDGTYIRADAIWHRATGKALYQINGREAVLMEPSFIDTFDALDVKGKVPSDEEIAAGSIKEPDGWNIISPKQKALDVELGPAAKAGGPEPSRSHARSGSVLPVLKRWYTSSEQLNATFESRVRGLLLGLALGDAVGSKESDLSTTGLLEAGVATQLAAWTVEGTLRAFTRYGVFQPHLPDIVLRAYRRWAVLRGLEPLNGVVWHTHAVSDGSGGQERFSGWLVNEPAMAQVRGASPTTERALVGGRCVVSAGCQAMLRVLPVAALSLLQHKGPSGGRLEAPDAQALAEEWARNVASLTHDDGDRQNTSALAVRILSGCLRSDRGVELAAVVQNVLDEAPYRARADAAAAVEAARKGPRLMQTLKRLAPDRTSFSALRGGLYVALSFPAEDVVTDAIEFAASASDGDSVAAVAGAILGARHGYEALPQQWLGRLELGWVMDRLARDLAAEVTEHQGGEGWKDAAVSGSFVVDPWWDAKYPGV